MNEETFIFSWEVKSFSLCSKEQGCALLIQKFRPFFDDSEWSAFLLSKYEDPNFLTFFLIKADNPANVEYRITLQLLSNDGVLRQEFTPYIIVPGKMFSFPQFVCNAELEQSCLCDTLRLQCKFKKVKEMITRTVFTYTRGHVMKISEKWSLEDFTQAPLGKVLQKSIKSLFDVCLSIEGRKGQRVVAIYFTRRCIPEEQTLSLNVLISVLNAKGVETDIYMQDQHVFCSTHEVWQFPFFITQTPLVEQKHEYLPNDILTLKCDIAINWCLNTTKNVSHCVKTNTQFVGALAPDMMDLYASKRFADVNIRTSGVTVPAHRIILHSRSKEFAKMLDEIEGTNNNFLDVPDVDIITLERMLKYMYTDDIKNLEHDDAVKLTLASRKYGIESLECKYSDDTINVFTDSSRNIRIYHPKI